jgi:hypothetical protein
MMVTNSSILVAIDYLKATTPLYRNIPSVDSSACWLKLRNALSIRAVRSKPRGWIPTDQELAATPGKIFLRVDGPGISGASAPGG